MDYELAKQLEDAGFKKGLYSIGDRFYEFDVYTNEPFLQWVSEWYLQSENFEELKTKLFVPTLSELIHACQPYFDMLISIPQIDWRLGSTCPH
jgi:hypothetical protein